VHLGGRAVRVSPATAVLHTHTTEHCSRRPSPFFAGWLLCEHFLGRGPFLFFTESHTFDFRASSGITQVARQQCVDAFRYITNSALCLPSHPSAMCIPSLPQCRWVPQLARRLQRTPACACFGSVLAICSARGATSIANLLVIRSASNACNAPSAMLEEQHPQLACHLQRLSSRRGCHPQHSEDGSLCPGSVFSNFQG
jgi:hypothetical protein